MVVPAGGGATRPHRISPISAATCAPESITSPDSFSAASRWSATTQWAMAASSSSRQVGRGAPTAATKAPGWSHSPSSTGALALVTVHTMSAPRTACSALAQATPPMSSAHALALAALGLHTRISDTSRTARSMCAWLRASTPLPSMATTCGLRGTSASAATAEAAAVRIAVMVLPSITARVWPVAGSISTMVLSSVGKPFWALPGTRVMSLVLSASPSCAGLRNSRPLAEASPMGMTVRKGCSTWPSVKATRASRTPLSNSGMLSNS